MKMHQNSLKPTEIKTGFDEGSEVKMVTKPTVTGKLPIYVSQYFLESSVLRKQDARMGPVLDNPLATLPRSTLSLRENGLK